MLFGKRGESIWIKRIYLIPKKRKFRYGGWGFYFLLGGIYERIYCKRAGKRVICRSCLARLKIFFKIKLRENRGLTRLCEKSCKIFKKVIDFGEVVPYKTHHRQRTASYEKRNELLRSGRGS